MKSRQRSIAHTAQIGRLTIRSTLTIAACLLVGAGTEAQPSPSGYLQPGAFDILLVLPPAPHAGDVRDNADRALFRSTRKLRGTPRWDLATNDVKLTPADMMRDFSCAAGITLTPQRAPSVAALIARAAIDTSRSSKNAKEYYHRNRPYLIDRGPICQPAEELHGNEDYPSGHATLGWTWATLLAELEPDHATAILARGRAYGESRIVCGVHNASSVEAGRLTAAATLAAVQASPTFRTDFDAAKRELDALRSAPDGPKPQSCDSEAKLVAQPIL